MNWRHRLSGLCHQTSNWLWGVGVGRPARPKQPKAVRPVPPDIKLVVGSRGWASRPP
ncbi:hypothetical protein [Microcoleus sp. F4-D5]|uniref:hypothetical protein n=1 Tax=Microcoleus sp. F4-D5 TaxID=2818760 RepID=UPI002FD6E159